jgi:DNA-binding NarL/FixJ family response regulator
VTIRKRVRILLADDHALVREGLKSLLRDSGEDWQVAGEASSGREALEMTRELKPDLVIMDVAMPDLNGIDATRLIKDERPETRVLGLSMHSDRTFVSEMLKAGASGYLLKDCVFAELSSAIQLIMKGELYICAGAINTIVRDYVRLLDKGSDSAFTILTPREREVVQLLAEGYSTKEAARRLMLSVKTVETHRQRVMKKLEVRSIADLTKYAIREGLTSPSK